MSARGWELAIPGLIPESQSAGADQRNPPTTASRWLAPGCWTGLRICWRRTMNLVPALLALAVATTVVRPLLFAVALLAHKRWGVAVTTLERLLRACDYRVIQPHRQARKQTR